MVIVRQWNSLSLDCVITMSSTSTSFLMSQSVTASPRTARSFAFVALNTFTALNFLAIARLPCLCCCLDVSLHLNEAARTPLDHLARCFPADDADDTPRVSWFLAAVRTSGRVSVRHRPPVYYEGMTVLPFGVVA